MSVHRSALRADAVAAERPRLVIRVMPMPATSTNVAAKRVDSGPVHGSKNRLIDRLADRTRRA